MLQSDDIVVRELLSRNPARGTATPQGPLRSVLGVATTNPGGAITCLRVVVVGTHPQVLDALVDLISDEPALELIGGVRTASEAIELALSHQPDVVAFDLDGPGGWNTRVLDTARTLLPRTRLIALSSYDDPAIVSWARSLGFHQYALKYADVIDIMRSSAEDGIPFR